MARPLDHEKRSQLLAGVVRYIGTHGLTDLSLRPLAAELGTSSRMLIYYFGTKEDLLIQALTTQRPDVSILFGDVEDMDGLRHRMEGLWQRLTVGESATSTRVLFQVMGAACVEKEGPFAGYVVDSVQVLVTELAAVIRRVDPSAVDAEATATVLVSGMRGILLDRLLTGDLGRTDRAAELIGMVLR